MSERDEAVLTLDTERVAWAAREKELKEETVMEVVKYGKTFMTSALFMVKEKYHTFHLIPYVSTLVSHFYLCITLTIVLLQVLSIPSVCNFLALHCL